jgi:hypothetical protein
MRRFLSANARLSNQETRVIKNKKQKQPKQGKESGVKPPHSKGVRMLW